MDERKDTPTGLLRELLDNSMAFYSAIECDHDFDGEKWAKRARAAIDDEASPPPEDPVANLDKRHAEELENPPEGITSEMVGRLMEVQALERQAMLDSLEEEKS